MGRCGGCGVLSVQTLNGETLKGIFGELLKHVITHTWAMVSRKLAIRDEPNIRLGCSRHVKNHLFYR